MKILFSPGMLLIKSGLYFFVPLCLLLHGIIWVRLGFSSAIMVYAMKLSYLLVLLGMMSYCSFKFDTRLHWRDNVVIFGFILVTSLSLLSPFFSDVGSLKYLVSDFVGFILIPIYYVAAVCFIRKYKSGVDVFISLIVNSTFIVSGVVIVYYFYSGGDKVSIPPEIHFGGAVSVALVLFARRGRSLSTLLKVLVIIFACIVSQQRINLIILVVPAIVFLSLNILNFKRIILFSLLLSILVSLIYVLKADLIMQVLMSFALSSSTDTGFQDGSANQRLVEISLIVREMSDLSWISNFLGKGFGAEYENYANIIPHYNDFMHHAHSSPFVIWLRNGILGVMLIFLLPTMYAPLYKMGGNSVIAFCGLLSTYVALLVDQYIYWGALFAFSLALASSVYKYSEDFDA